MYKLTPYEKKFQQAIDEFCYDQNGYARSTFWFLVSTVILLYAIQALVSGTFAYILFDMWKNPQEDEKLSNPSTATDRIVCTSFPSN
jgi:heme/copper-type cytochrome/quinol oxidase subunit 2